MNAFHRVCITLVFLSCWSVWGLAGEVTGTVKWEGPVPKLRPIKMDADPVCEAHHPDTMPVSETLVLGDGNTMGNIVVHIKSGLPDKKYGPPKDAAVFDQRGCIYIPHVLGVMVDQDVKILNSDGILHNVNVGATENRGFNLGMPKGTTEAVKSFSRPEFPIDVKCNVHPWMKAYIVVFEHPFFSVTAEDGKFTIKNLPPGTYEVEAWHERAGTRKASVTIAADGGTQTVDFTFSRPK